MPTVGDKVSNLDVLISPSSGAVAYLVDSGDFKGTKESIQNWIGMGKSGVKLIKGDGTVKFYPPTANTDASRWATSLVPALEDATSDSRIYLFCGNYEVPTGEPMVDSIGVGVTGVKVFFEKGSALLYTDPEDAGDDCDLFVGTRNIVNFGAVSTNEGDTPVDCAGAIQAAWNSLPLYPDLSGPYLLDSGRYLRSGNVSAPDGTYWIGSQIVYSPTTRFIGSSMRGSIFKIIDSSATGAGAEVIFFKWDNCPTIDPNNLFGTYFENFILSCPTPSLNTRASGWSIAGGQGTGGRNVIVTNFYRRNVISWGGIYTGCWFPEVIIGPSIDGVMGAAFDVVSVEHSNATGNVDLDGSYDAVGDFWPATGRTIPAARFRNGHYAALTIQGEQGFETPGDLGSTSDDQTLVELINVLSFKVGSMMYGVANGSTRDDTILRVAGSSQNVRVDEIVGTTNGESAYEVGTLVYDDSTFSPAGSGIPYILDGPSNIRGTYSQKAGGFVPGMDLDNVFTGDNYFGNPANFTDGLTVRSSLGNVSIIGGAYNTTRTESYFDYNVPKTQDWNASAMRLTSGGVLNVIGSYQVDGVKVVGNQGVAIPDTSGASLATLEAEVNKLKEMARTHGLIA